MKTTHRIGQLADGGSVYVEIELRDTDKGIELSISGSAPNTGGQIHDTVAAVGDFAPGWDAATRDRLLATWKAYHLNGMRPNCPHQVGEDWTPKEIRYTEYSIEWDARWKLESQHATYCTGQGVKPDMATAALQKAIKWSPAAEILVCLRELGLKPFQWGTCNRQYLTRKINRLPFELRPSIGTAEPDTPGRLVILERPQMKTTGWLTEAEHPDGYLSKPCPECGYKYGTKWLFVALPDDELQWLRALQAGDTATDDEPQDIEASAFLETHGISFTAKHSQRKANGWAKKAQHWRVTLAQAPVIDPASVRDAKAKFVVFPAVPEIAFDFWNSQHDTEAGIDLDAAAVLSSLASDIGYDDPDDLAQELELSPSQAYAAVAFAERLRGFFTEDQREGLARLC